MRRAVVLLVILSVIFMLPELMYIAFSFVIFFALISFTPSFMEGSVEIEKGEVVTGSKNKAVVRMKLGGGIGIVFVRLNLPEEFEALSNNINAFYMIKGTEKELQFEFVCSKRGEYQIEAQMEIRDVLGRRIKTHTVGRADLTVRPVMAKIKRIKVKKAKSRIPLPQTGRSRLGALTTDLEDIRPYNNDPFKFINWKASARLYGKYRTLLVNDFEREGKRTVILLLDARKFEGSSIRNTLETAIEIVLAVSYITVRNSQNVGVYILGQKKFIVPSSGKSQFYKIMNWVTRIEPDVKTSEKFPKVIENYKKVFLEYNPQILVLTTIDSNNIGEFEEGIRRLTSMGLRTTLINIVPYEFYEKKVEHIDTMLSSLLRVYSRRLSRRGARVINWNPVKVRSVRVLQVM